MTFQYLDSHLSHLNFTTRDRLDPLIIQILKLFSLDQSQTSYVFLQLAIILIGLCYLLHIVGVRKQHAILEGLSCVTALVFIVGIEPVYLKFHWFPFLFGSFLALRRNFSVRSYVLAVFSILEWSLTAGFLGVFGTLVSLAASAPEFLGTDKQTPASTVKTSGQKICLQALGAVTLVLSVLLMPVYPMPDYPPAARVVPVSPFTFLFYPLLGPMIEPNPLLYPAVVENMQICFQRLLIVFLVVMTTRIFERDTRLSLQLLSWSVTFTVLLLELFVPPSFLPYTPFQTLCRIIPGLALAPLVWCIIPFGIVYLFALGFKNPSGQRNRLKQSAMLLFSLMSLLTIDYSIPELRFWKAQIPVADHFQHAQETKSGNRVQQLKQSPSGYIIEHHGDWVGAQGLREERNTANLVQLSQLSSLNWISHASILDQESLLAIDGRTDTRWKTGRPQRPGDFFLLTAPEPTAILKAVLSIPNEPTDFPKGIEVQGSLDGQEYWTIFSELPWPGPLRWTEAGYPYYGFQSNIVFEFPKEEKVKYLRFIQLGSEDYYDWSINEVFLYRKQ